MGACENKYKSRKYRTARTKHCRVWHRNLRLKESKSRTQILARCRMSQIFLDGIFLIVQFTICIKIAKVNNPRAPAARPLDLPTSDKLAKVVLRVTRNTRSFPKIHGTVCSALQNAVKKSFPRIRVPLHTIQYIIVGTVSNCG